MSVNVHEPHAHALARRLLGAGIGVEAGVWTPDAAQTFLSRPERGHVLRVLLELPDAPEVSAQAQVMLAKVDGARLNVPTLLHGLNRSAWAMVALAARLGLSTRTGLEDTLHLPDGTPAPDNAALVRAARHVLASAR